MRRPNWPLVFVLALLLSCGLSSSLAAQSQRPQHLAAVSSKPLPPAGYPIDWVQQFVPDSRDFWDNSYNWTTNYGPAYRGTVETPTQMLGCSTQFALCFHSGAEPYPCNLAADGQTANCLCTVATTTNYTLIDAILNYPIYQQTVAACGSNGAGCPNVGQAPVCSYLQGGTLMPGADVISTFDPESRQEIITALATGAPKYTECVDQPYAECMTAPCLLNSDGTTANCKCPVFKGNFQLTGNNNQCVPGPGLVPSASYIPKLDTNRNN
jgi:hypothetical protein